MYPPPRVFFVRVANKGFMLDAASRFAGNGVMEGIVCGLEGLKVGTLGCKGEREVSALGPRAPRRFGVEVAGGEENMGNGSRRSTGA